MKAKNIILNICKAVLVVTPLLFNAHAADMNKPAPNFTLKSYEGKNVKLSEYRGKVVLLNFWASWCGPCRQEMPLLQKIHKKYSSLGFAVMGVNVEEDNTKAKGIVKKNKLTFPILFDSQNQVSQLYKVDAMPSTVIIDRSGRVRYIHKGYKPGDEKAYKKWVKKLVREI